MIHRKTWIAVLLGILVLLSGCSIEKTDRNKVKDLDFTVMEESQIPEELLTAIDEKKANEFKLTFATEDSLYIVVGYGAQATNGYSISVEELYLTSNAIYMNTNLIGPAKGEVVSEVESFPYIVIKTGFIDKSVVFE